MLYVKCCLKRAKKYIYKIKINSLSPLLQKFSITNACFSIPVGEISLWFCFRFMQTSETLWDLFLMLCIQYSWPLRGILEGSWLCQAFMEEQAGAEGWRCWHCSFVWAGMLCMVLCWRDCGKGFYYHWLPCLRMTTVFRGLNV